LKGPYLGRQGAFQLPSVGAPQLPSVGGSPSFAVCGIPSVAGCPPTSECRLQVPSGTPIPSPAAPQPSRAVAHPTQSSPSLRSAVSVHRACGTPTPIDLSSSRAPRPALPFNRWCSAPSQGTATAHVPSGLVDGRGCETAQLYTNADMPIARHPGFASTSPGRPHSNPIRRLSPPPPPPFPRQTSIPRRPMKPHHHGGSPSQARTTSYVAPAGSAAPCPICP
jgi:hypothetical protein